MGKFYHASGMCYPLGSFVARLTLLSKVPGDGLIGRFQGMVYLVAILPMKEIRILSWNVNGIRAAGRKGFLPWLHQESPDTLCLQETKAQSGQIPAEIEYPAGYHACWNFPERKGYSGVATLSKEEPIKVENGFGITKFDMEGRVTIARYIHFTLVNVYFPNGKMNEERLRYKMDFYDAFLQFADSLKAKGEKLIICGDFNTAHREIDLA